MSIPTASSTTACSVVPPSSRAKLHVNTFWLRLYRQQPVLPSPLPHGRKTNGLVEHPTASFSSLGARAASASVLRMRVHGSAGDRWPQDGSGPGPGTSTWLRRWVGRLSGGSLSPGRLRTADRWVRRREAPPSLAKRGNSGHDCCGPPATSQCRSSVDRGCALHQCCRVDVLRGRRGPRLVLIGAFRASGCRERTYLGGPSAGGLTEPYTPSHVRIQHGAPLANLGKGRTDEHRQQNQQKGDCDR